MLKDFKTLKEVNRVYNDVNTRNDLVPALISQQSLKKSSPGSSPIDQDESGKQTLDEYLQQPA